MISNVKKVPPLAKGTRRPARPYPKADITIEDQQREQRKLLNAGKAFSGYSHLNLEIIAISYEHKCFAEAKSREDYIAKIGKKLNEWKYAPVDEEDTHGLGRLQPPPQPPGQQKGQPLQPSQQLPKTNRSNHQRHRSGPPLQPKNTNGSAAPGSPVKTGFPRTNQFPYPIKYESPEQDSKRVGQQAGQPFGNNRNGAPYQSPPLEPQRQPRAQTSSPKSQPMSHNMTNMSDTSSNGSSQDKFLDIFDPKFLAGFDLNNPEVRAVWLKSVWEHFVSGASWNGYGANGQSSDSPSNSPIPMHSTPSHGYGSNGMIDGPVDIDVNMQGIHENDIMGAFVNFNTQRPIPNGRRQSEDLGRPRVTNHHEALNGHQWLTSDFNSMDMSMGGLDGVMAVDGMGPTGLTSRHWVLQ
ncbi:hypothetical protein DFH27DRAFT_606561 [Peziza echinospora]|nr:hypothetical protein DFH27DRAFT_606561 [Peziza echinospora]